MTRTAAPLAIALGLSCGLAACMSNAPSNPEPVATQQMPYRAGQGTVIAAARAPAPMSAAVGGTTSAVSATAPTHRLTIRMSDGSVQYVDTDNAEITVGSRVELGADRTIRPM